MAVPHLILIGYGVTDSLQLTVEAQRVLSRYGSAYTIGLPPNLAAFLKTQRVKTTDLSPRLGAGSATAEGYLDVAHFVLERTAGERPVVLLSPGNPLVFNAIGRYLAMEGARLGLTVQSLGAVSQLDLIVAGIGLDVSTFGLQVFDAARMVARRQPVSPEVPLLLMHLGGLLQSGTGSLDELVSYVSPCYPADQATAIITLGLSGMTVSGARLGELPQLAGELGPGSHLFIDAVRKQPQGAPAA